MKNDERFVKNYNRQKLKRDKKFWPTKILTNEYKLLTKIKTSKVVLFINSWLACPMEVFYMKTELFLLY